jgi:hypothetical protein
MLRNTQRICTFMNSATIETICTDVERVGGDVQRTCLTESVNILKGNICVKVRQQRDRLRFQTRAWIQADREKTGTNASREIQ